jgi:hypothetical protein
MSLLALAGTNSATGGYEIDNSCKFEADNTEIIYRTNESGTNRKTFTVSAWFKRTELGADQQVWHGGNNGEATRMGILSYQYADDNLWVDIGGGSGNTGTLYRSYSTLKIRDTSAWYHFVLAVDTTQATEANRMKVWLNGVEVTDWAQHQIPAQDFQCALESGIDMAWGGYRPSNVVLLSGYLAECHYLDGVTAVQTDFGEYDEDSGIWKPKAYAGSYGGNGCYLNFDDSASLGADSSGNGNTFTLNNITSADQATDTPTNNFATGNPLVPLKANTILTEGATNFKNVGSAGWAGFAPSIAVQSGKWYVEFTAAGATTFCGVGNVNNFLNSIYYGNWNTSIGFYGTAGLLFIDGATQTWSGLAYGSGDIVGIALDKDNGYVYMSKNGTWANSGDPTSGASGTGGVALTQGNSDYSASDYFYIGASQDIDNGILQANYGGYTTDTPASPETDANGYGTFEYAPPSGYYALCTKNLEEFG